MPCKDSGMPAFVGPFGLAGVLPGGPPVKINKCFYLTDFLIVRKKMMFKVIASLLIVN